jgi:hypothetical protein
MNHCLSVWRGSVTSSWRVILEPLESGCLVGSWQQSRCVWQIKATPTSSASYTRRILLRSLFKLVDWYHRFQVNWIILFREHSLLCRHAVNGPLCSQVMNWVFRLLYRPAYCSCLNSSASGASSSTCCFIWCRIVSQGNVKYVRTQPSTTITRDFDVSSGMVL